MKSLALTVVLLAISGVPIIAQANFEVQVNPAQKTVVINGSEFSENSKMADYEKVLGPVERIEKIAGVEYIYAYDQKGISLMINPNSKNVQLISITYIYDGDKKVAKEPFKGTLIVNGETISQQSTIESIKKTSKLEFKEVMKGFFLSERQDFNLLIFYPQNGGVLGQFGVQFGTFR
jgi:hypothetical protein